jgi:hypothetical protein
MAFRNPAIALIARSGAGHRDKPELSGSAA